MITRLVLENFMAHSRTEIELGEGLTVLVGPNNCGKSAVVEALRILCRNLPGEVAVRHGEKLCRVTACTDDGHTLSWQRKGSTVSYEIDGKPYHRLGRDIPEDLHKFLRLPQVETSVEAFDVHFGLQKSPMFLLGEKSEAKIAAFFASSSDAENLMEMQRKHREKVRNAKTLKNDWEDQQERSAKQLQAMGDLDQMGAMVEQAEKEFGEIRAREQDVANIGGTIDDIETLLLRQAGLTAELAALEHLSMPPKMENADRLQALVDRMDQTSRMIERESHRANAIHDLRQPPNLAETALLESILAGMQRGAGQASQAIARLDQIMKMLPVPNVEDDRVLDRSCREMERAYKAVAAAAGRCEKVRPMQPPPQIMETAGLEQLIGAWTENRSRATLLAVDVVDADTAMKQSEADIRAWAERNPTCPVCGGAVDPSKVLGQEHSHV